MVKLIETTFGKSLYKEISKVYIAVFGDFPATMPDNIRKELEVELNETEKI